MFGAKFCYHTMPDELDIFDYDEYNSNPMTFFVVCTDVETGRPVYKKVNTADYNGLEWIRASASMPLASRIVEVDGRKLLDGGISDSIPLSFMERHGYERNIVILTQPRDYIKKPNKSISLIKSVYKKYPKLIKAYSERPDMYNKQLEHIRNSESEGKAFVIAPPKKLDIRHVEHNPDKLLEVYRTGRKAAMENLDRILEFMGE
jgi:predicted patatin/cPLA2 family phospholipase